MYSGLWNVLKVKAHGSKDAATSIARDFPNAYTKQCRTRRNGIYQTSSCIPINNKLIKNAALAVLEDQLKLEFPDEVKQLVNGV